MGGLMDKIEQNQLSHLVDNLKKEVPKSRIVSGKQAWDPYKFYEESEAFFERNEFYKKRRAELKAEWRKRSTNPFRGIGPIVSICQSSTVLFGTCLRVYVVRTRPPFTCWYTN